MCACAYCIRKRDAKVTNKADTEQSVTPNVQKPNPLDILFPMYVPGFKLVDILKNPLLETLTVLHNPPRLVVARRQAPPTVFSMHLDQLLQAFSLLYHVSKIQDPQELQKGMVSVFVDLTWNTRGLLFGHRFASVVRETMNRETERLAAESAILATITDRSPLHQEMETSLTNIIRTMLAFYQAFVQGYAVFSRLPLDLFS